MDFARELWLRIETLHAVTYFGDETTEGAAVLGLNGFWSSYFAFRAAPMGAVNSGVVEATFFNFAPSFVQRWVPDVWSHAAPPASVGARREAAVRTLTRVTTDEAALAALHSNSVLEAAVGRAVAAGRPLFAANRDVLLSDEPVARLWQLCTALREHRGDGHVAALTAAGLDGLEAHVLIAIEQGNSPDDLQRTRGWTADEWDAAVDRCRIKGLVDADSGLTDAGRSLRDDVEVTTDRLAAQPFESLTADARQALLDSLTPPALAVVRSGLIRFPNPMGLPPLS